MAISFQEPSFQSSNSILTGMGIGNDLLRQAITNRMLSTQSQYLEPSLQQDLLKQQLANKISGVQVQYADPMAQAALKLANLQPGYLSAQTDLTNAQTGLTNAQMNMLPLKTQAEMIAAQARMGQGFAAQQNALRQWTSTPQYQELVQTHPELAQQTIQAIQNSAGMAGGIPQTGGIPQSGMLQQLIQPTMQSVQQPQNYVQSQQAPYEQNPMAQNIQQQLMAQQAPQMAQAQDKQINSQIDDIKRLQETAASQKALKMYGQGGSQIIQAGNRFINIAPQVLDNYDKASVYFSPQGQAQLKIDQTAAFRSGGKEVPVTLRAYNQFMQGIKELELQGAKVNGVPADQIARGEYQKVFDIPTITSNPVAGREYLSNAIRLGLMAHQTNLMPPGERVSQTGQLGQTAQSLEKNLSKTSYPGQIPKGRIAVISPDGQEGHIPTSQLNEAIKAGYTRK